MRTALALLLFAHTAYAASVADAVEQAARTPAFQTAIWFVLVEEEDGRIVYERNARTLAIPASVRKLFTAATIAQCLGLENTVETQLWLDGDDVVVKGGGDPSFGSDRYGYIPETIVFQPFIRALRARGITQVRDVIADVSMFDRVTIPYQWKIGNILSSYAAPIDALAWSENHISGYAVASAGHFAGMAFRDALEAEGIRVTGRVRTESEPQAWREYLTSVQSPVIHHLLATVLKPSHNLSAEMLYKRTSAGEEKASYDRARELERIFLINEVAVEDGSFRFVDGSGLAPDDLVTPAAAVKMLRWMNHPARRGIWWNLLAEPGAQEGTLRSRLTPLATRLRAKTGTVAGVNALAGIIEGANGGYRYFAIMVNHHIGSSAAVNRLIDSIVLAAADF